MHKRARFVLLAIILLVVFGPALLELVSPNEGRRFTGVLLEETTFEEIAFQNRRQELALAGLLFVPNGDGPFPAAIMIHGSGTSFRDNGWYITLTDYLVRKGIIVLLPDKRGSVGSAGDWRTASFEDLATDTLAAVDYLKSRNDLAISQVGVIGMSQGGWIAPIVASQSSAVEFLVSFSGAAVTPTEQLYYEEKHNLLQAGFLPGIADALALLSTTWVRHVAQRDFWRAVGGYDPLVYWGSLQIDALALLGANDTNVPVAETAARLRELGNPRIEIRIFDGSGHVLEDPVDAGTRIVRDDAADAVANFVLGSR